MSGFVGLPGSAGPWSGGAVGERAICVLAPNPGINTLDGTNTWVLHEPGDPAAIVIDPGPADTAHFESIEAVLARRNARIGIILLTHGHFDHSAGAHGLASRANCKVRALDPRHRLGDEGLGEQDVVTVGTTEVRVISTPGHSADSLSFHLPVDRAVLTGDTILGRGTTVVAYPDGRLGDYLESLQRLRDLADEAALSAVLPGHGPALPDPAGVLDAYLQHRHSRLEEVRSAARSVRGAGNTADDICEAVVEIVYADLPKTVWPLARLSARAQLEYLAELDQATAQ